MPFPTVRRAGHGVAGALVLALMWSCSSSDPNPTPPNTTPTDITINAGDTQTADAGSQVSTSPS